MKYYFTCIFFICIIVLGYGQKMTCSDCDLYSTALSKKKITSDMPLMVKFDFEMSASLKESLFEANIFDIETQKLIESSFKNSAPIPCRKIKRRLVELKAISTPGDYEEYVLVKYSNAVHINEEKAYLFLEHLIVKKNRGVAGGATVLEEFKKIKNTWELKETRILESY